jgi:hypothetical protein
MNVTDFIQDKINRFSRGYVFSYSDLGTNPEDREATIKALNRMVKSGLLDKVSKGRFYKPETTEFGVLEPNRYQVVKDLLEKNGKIIGYLTGYNAFNELGLTTQLPNIIQIGRNEIRPPMQRGIYKITFIRQNNIITKENVEYLKILDAIKLIKKVPDTKVDNSILKLRSVIKKIPTDKIQYISKLAVKYPPSTRAVFGAMVELEFDKNTANSIRTSLNPITQYKLNISQKILPNAENWNIK